MGYDRFSWASGRSETIVFTESSLIQTREGGNVYWTFRVCDMRKQPLLEPQVRVYCVTHTLDESHPAGINVKVVPLPLCEPRADIADGKMFLSLPCNVSHRIDQDSPFVPPQNTKRDFSAKAVQEYLNSIPYIELIAVVAGTDSVTGNLTERRQSYTKLEILWEQEYAHCVFIRN